EEEDVFVIGGRAGFRRAGHGIRLVPDAVSPQVPAVVNQGQSDSPRQAELRAVVVFVADDQPQRAGSFHDAAAFTKDGRQPSYIVGGRGLAADLNGGAAVIALLPVGRAGDDAINQLVGPAL